MSKMLAFAKRHPFRLALSAIALLVALLSASLFSSSPNAALIGQPINLEPVVSLDQVGEDEFDMRIAEQKFEHKLYALGSGENRQAHAKQFWGQRAYPAEQVSSESFHNARSAEAERRTPQDQAAMTWESIGPTPLKASPQGTLELMLDVSGRALAVALQPGNSNHILVGTAQGGIWQSTDGGATFNAVADNMPSLAIKVIRFAPSDPNIVYAGSGEPHGTNSIYGMGVFKSTDGGTTWSALPSNGEGWDFRNVAVSGLQVDPNNPNTLIVTTAAVQPAFETLKPASTPQTGIFKSTDGGQTWTRKQDAVKYAHQFGTLGEGFMDLELFQANSSVLFATELFGGIYRSTDAGESWQLMTPAKNLSEGQAPHQDMGATFPATVSQYSYYTQDFENEIAQFDTHKTSSRPEQYPEFHRIEITLAQSGGNINPTDPNTYILYAGYGTTLGLDVNDDGKFNQNDGDLLEPTGLIFKSSDGGQTWQWLGDWANQGVPNYCRNQCYYDNMVEVNPSDPNDVIVGGNGNVYELFPDPVVNPTRYLYKPWSGIVHRSLDGGTTWIDTTPGCTSYQDTGDTVNDLPVHECVYTEAAKKTTHVDVHGAAYDWDNQRIYVVNDGGLNRVTVSGDGTNNLTDYRWETLNENLSTLQFFDFASHPTDPNKIIGGMQDNASGYWNGEFWDGWTGGDGSGSAFDPAEPNIVYVGDPSFLIRHDNGGSKNSDEWEILFFGTIGEGDPIPFLQVLEIDPVETNIIYVASMTGIYRSTDRGDNWQGRLNETDSDGEPTTISVSPQNHNLVWAGTSTGQLYLFDFDSGQQFTRTGSNFPNRYISKIEASPNDADTVYVTFSGYDVNSANTDNGGNGNVGKVFKSTDQGMTWTDISGNLTPANNLDVPVLAFAMDPNNENRMWIGTDIATYQTTDGGSNWVSYRHNMPMVAIMELEYNANTKYLMVATHGRGIWRVQPDAPPSMAGPPLAVEDYDIPNGHFFTQTADEGGFSVLDDSDARFWSEFNRLGGLQTVGYPISQRFVYDGFVVQAFQKLVLQWRPEVGQAWPVNLFDALSKNDFDQTLLATRQTPLPLGSDFDDPNASWEETVAKRQALLDGNEAIRARYFSVDDPLTVFGLPTSQLEDMGNHIAIRTQRAVFQQWSEDTIWADKGQVTIANGGDIAKELGWLPEASLEAETAP